MYYVLVIRPLLNPEYLCYNIFMSETITETAPEAAVANPDIEWISKTLPELSAERIKETADFVSFLIEKEHKHKAFVEETLAVIANPDYITCNTAEEVMNAIRNADDD